MSLGVRTVVFSASDDEVVPPNDTRLTDIGESDSISVAPTLKKGIVKNLNPNEVRWFYKAEKNASWSPFKGRDSLLIELKWRLNTNSHLGEEFPGRDILLDMCKNAIVVLDGYYELIIGDELEVKPIYWQGESLKVMRGSWFFETDWRPLSEKMAVDVEDQHLKIFMGQNIPEKPVYSDKGQKPLLHSMKAENCVIEWNSILDVSIQITSRTWMMYLRLKSNVSKLCRMYHTEAVFDDGPPPVNQLIFVVHGIGQKRQVNRIVTNTNGMRGVADRILKQNYAGLKFRPMFLPVEWRTCLKLDEDIVTAITPSKLQYVRELLNSTVMDILYYSSPKYRSEVTDGLVQVVNKLYSLFISHNPHFTEIKGEVSIVAHSLGSVISYDVITGWSPLKQYEDFMKNKLKKVVDSLRLTAEAKNMGQTLEDVRAQFDHEGDELIKMLLIADANSVRLKFRVVNLFCMGSPLAVFLALRGQRGADDFRARYPILYNIFHPNDPVAYRLEPLVHPVYAKLKPIRIHRYDAKNPAPYGEMPMELNKKDAGHHRKTSRNKQTSVELAMAAQSDEALVESDGRVSPDPSILVPAKRTLALPARSWSWAVLSKFRKEAPRSDTSPTKENKEGSLYSGGASSSGSAESLKDLGSVSVGRVDDSDPFSVVTDESRLPYRMDYILKESAMDYEIVSALFSHSGYWIHNDVVMFILCQIYGMPTDKIDKKLE